MKIPNKINLKTVAIIVCLSILLTSGFLFYTFAQTPSSTFVITGGVYVGAPSYTMWREGSNYFAKDSNGRLQYSGTNASDIIHNVLVALNNKGGIIFFLKGEYLLDSTIVVTQKYIEITGEGTGLNGTQFTLADNTHANMFNLSDATMFRLTNVRLNGNEANNNKGHGVYTGYDDCLTTGDIVLDHVFIRDFKDDGVHWVDAWGSIITNSYIEGNGQHGAALYGYNYLIKGNTFNWNKEYGLRLSGDGGGISLIGNTVCENYKDGIYAYGGKDITITGNLIRGNGVLASNTYDGIYVSSGCDNLTISANAVDGKGVKEFNTSTIYTRYGIRIDSAEATCVGNSIVNCGTDEISAVSGVVLEANYGYLSENCGSVSIATGATVSHGLAETPTSVVVTAGVTGLSNIFVDTFTITTFKINFAGGGSQTFYWYAEYKP